MRAHRVQSVFVLHDSLPTMYASLDVEASKQANPFETRDLINDGKRQLSHPQTEIGYNHLHVTMKLLNDAQEASLFSQLAPVTMATDYLYTDRFSFSAASVLLPQIISSEFNMQNCSVPHLSLMKPEDSSWKNTGPRLKTAAAATDWEPSQSEWTFSPSCGLWRKPLIRVLYAEPKVHPLCD